MELYKSFIKHIDVNIIYCLIPIILTLFFIDLFFKNRFETKKTLNLVCWVIIIYTSITWTVYLIGMAINPDEYAFVNRATGPYAVSYWIMLLSALLLPFTLLIKKLASKYWYVLLVLFAMKSGIFLERFIIIITSFHRDYLPINGNFKLENEDSELIDIFLYAIGMIFLQGILITILTLIIFEIIKRKKAQYSS